MRSWHFLIITGILGANGAGSALAKEAPKSFRDCPDCVEMVTIPAGSFIMGATIEEEIRHSGGKRATGGATPVHQVTFAKPFAIAKYPVTVGEFRKFVDETGYQTPDTCFTQLMLDRHSIYEKGRGYTWRSPGFPQNDKHPVVCVSWEDSMAYATWLSRKTGKNYTLPNEAQYEYAARAGTTTSFFWGDNRDETACLYANQPDLDQAPALGKGAEFGPEYRFQCHDGYAFTSPVGIYRPNPFGLYDMQGNIWEFTLDCYNKTYEGAPVDGSTWTTGDCDAHMARGGSYGNSARATYVGSRAPRDADFRGHSWGFRVARND